MKTSRPVVAFAHANGIPGHSYQQFLAPVGEDYKIEILDRLGHDPRYPVGRNWEALSQELQVRLASLPKPLVGVGHSLGATLMFLVAHRRPEWFSALVMLDPAMTNGWHGAAMKLAKFTGQVDAVTPAGKTRGRMDFWQSRRDAQDYFSSRPLFQRFDPRCLQDYLDAGLEPHKGGWRLYFRPSVEVDIYRHTPTNITRRSPLAIPGALINGEDSPGPFLACGQRHARRHRMQHSVVEGGHLFPLEHPRENGTRLRAVIESLLEPTDAGA